MVYDWNLHFLGVGCMFLQSVYLLLRGESFNAVLLVWDLTIYTHGPILSS